MRGAGRSKSRLPSPQLTLELGHQAQLTAEDFFISRSNEKAYSMIDLWPEWPDPILLLLGPKGSGKSHLGAIWAARAGARIEAGAAFQDLDLAGLPPAPVLLIEDACWSGTAEAKLFHLTNLVRTSGGALVLTAQNRPDAWGLSTPDLLSRLRLAPSVTIDPPDEGLMRAVLVKLFIDRQLIVDTSLIEYAALRLDRSLDSARRFVDILDKEALARRSRMTRAIASEVIAALQTVRPEDEAGLA